MKLLRLVVILIALFAANAVRAAEVQREYVILASTLR